MENATKALLMAAGILITIIILSLAIVVYGRVSSYYQTKQGNLTQEQLAAFNNEYAAYDRNDVTGFELVSLINKTIDFNQNRVYGASNTGESEEKLGDGYEEMSIIVKLKDQDWILFNNNTEIKYNGKNNTTDKRQLLTSAILEMQELERNINSNDLKKLTSYITDLNKISNTEDIYSFIEEKTGKNYTTAFNKVGATDLNKIKNKIKKYDEYLKFKRAEYKCLSNKTVYKNGQIVEMSFVQK